MDIEEFKKLKPGDKVRIVSKKTGSGWDPKGLMNKWLGKVMTVRANYGVSVYMEEDKGEGGHDGLDVVSEYDKVYRVRRRRPRQC